MKRNISLFFLFFGIDILFYWNLWNTYFQQDEWFLFGRAIYQSQHLPWSVFDFASKHFWPLGNVFWLFLYKTIGFHAVWYAFLGLFLHSVAAVAFLTFLLPLVKKRWVALLLSTLFLISFPAKQVVVWFVVSPFLIPCVIFILLFFIYLQKCQKKSELYTKDVVILSLLFVASFFFREESVVLLVLLPVYVYLFWPKNSRRKVFLSVAKILLFMIVMIVFRFILEKFIGENVHFEGGNPFVAIVYNIVSTPPKMILQNYIDVEDWWKIAGFYTHLAFPWLLSEGGTIVNTVFEDVIFLFSIPLALVSGLLWSKMSSEKKKIFLFSISWIMISSLILAPGGRRLQFLESRYLYIGNIGVMLFSYVLISTLIEKIKTKWRMIAKMCVVFLVIGYGVYSLQGIKGDMAAYYLPEANQRKAIIAQITKLYLSIPKNVAFYATCSQKEDCTLNPRVFPFQSGVGQMLMVLYGSKDEKSYAPFFKEFYLWDWDAQGYEKINSTGFGYFVDFSKLRIAVRKNHIPVGNVRAMQYDKKSNKVTDISSKIQAELEQQ